MKKLMIAIAGAVAVGCSAFADDRTWSWFDAGVAAGFPTAASMTGGAWDATAADKGAWTGSAIEVSADAEDPLTFTATEAKTLDADTKNVAVDSVIKFTPFETLPAVPANAKAGVVALKGGNYYVLLKDANGATNVWIDSAVAAADAAVAVNVQIAKTVDGYLATYTIGGTALAPAAIAMPDATVSSVNFTGDG